MARKLLSIEVRGHCRRWEFEFYGDPAHLDEWRADGLEVYEVVNIVPVWVAELGLTKPWCWAQDVFNFKWRREK